MNSRTEQIIASNKKYMQELNKEIKAQTQFREEVEGQSVCFNCEHNIRLYIDKGECKLDEQLHSRTFSCSKFKKKK